MIQRFAQTQRRIFTDRMLYEMRRWLPSWPKVEIPDSKNVLIEGGSMQHPSLSRIIYEKLMSSFRAEYSDHPKKESLLSSMTTNFNNEIESAWAAFLAEIGDNDEQD